MSISSLVLASVNPSPFPATYTISSSHPKNETASQAVNIGNLTEESAIVSVSDQGTAAGSPVSSTFTTQTGDVTSLLESFNNVVEQASTRFQLYNSSGAIVADNQGTAAQQTAYQAWADGGLALGADTYTAVATPLLGSEAPSISTDQQQGTSLEVNSQLTGSDPSEYYNFAFTAGNNIKLALDAGANNPSVRVQLLDANGNVVADSQGNPFQQSNYQALTSGNGLTATTGNYTVEVSYANGANNGQNVNYNMQLFSGTNYSVVYNNNIKAQPTDNSATGSVTATSDAMAYSRQAYNIINPTTAEAVNIGWMAENQSSLNVNSQLTTTDNTDIYSFTLQSGNNLKFGFDTTQTANPSDYRVQILDGTGSEVIADSDGTAAQQAAYRSLTTSGGLQAKPGQYLVKISYAPHVTPSTQTYDFNLYSGTSFAAQYKTIASPQTYGNAVLEGDITGSASTATAIASYLTAASNGATPDIMATLKSLA